MPRSSSYGWVGIEALILNIFKPLKIRNYVDAHALQVLFFLFCRVALGLLLDIISDTIIYKDKCKLTRLLLR